MKHEYDGQPCLESNCWQVAVKKSRCKEHQLPAFYGNFRKERLPENWGQLKKIVMQRDKGICYICGETGADGVDHIENNDDNRLTNLAAVHHNVPNSKQVYCHRIKTSQEGLQARRDQKLAQYGRTWQEELYKREKQKKENKMNNKENEESKLVQVEETLQDTKTTYIIIAAGEATRWNNYLDRPKHLAPILGEPIIHRTQRLLTEYIKEGDEGFIVVKDPKTHRPYLSKNSPFKLRKAKLNENNGDADKIISSRHLWSDTGRTVVIWGDTFLTEKAVNIIATSFPEKFLSVARWGNNPYTGSIGGENFAHIISKEAQEEYNNALNRVVDLYKNKLIPRNGGWEIYKAFNNLPDADIYRPLDGGGNYNPKLDYAYEIIDGSEDFDAPSDWDNWCYNYSTNPKHHTIMTKGE